MVDDHHSAPKGGFTRPLTSRPRHQRIDHASSRVRAENAASYRAPTNVPDIKSRLKDALQREVEMKRLTDIFPPKQSTPAPQQSMLVAPDPAPNTTNTPLNVKPLPVTEPASESNHLPKSGNQPAGASPSHDSDEAKPIMNENGFQIFKPDRPEEKEVAAKSLGHHADDEVISKDAEAVPMKADAIEEALRLISNDEDNAEDASADNNTPADIGFIPANINPGIFGAAPSSSDNDGASDQSQHIDEEQLINDILSGDVAMQAEDASLTSDAEASEKSTASLHVISGDGNDASSSKEKIHNLQIGQAIASSIRGIVKDEVDTALDQMARNAVREVLASYR